jgi:hypothetical protein
MTALSCVGIARAQPTPPATFLGTVTIDGKPAPEGTLVRAFIDGRDCTQTGAAGVRREGSQAAYSIQVLSESQAAGCGAEGRRVAFTVAGRLAAQEGEWHAIPQVLNLEALPISATATATLQPGASPGTLTPAPAQPATTSSTGAAAAAPVLTAIGPSTPVGASLDPGASREGGKARSAGARLALIGSLAALVGLGAAVAFAFRRRARRNGR